MESLLVNPKQLLTLIDKSDYLGMNLMWSIFLTAWWQLPAISNENNWVLLSWQCQ